MNPILLNPKIDSSASTTEQLAQMKSYLRQFKEQVELILMNIDTDNMSEKFQDEVYEGMSKKIMGDKTMSEIAQTAGMIKMSVKDLQGSVASLTLTTSGIQSQVTAEVNRATGAEQALSSSISQTAGEIALKVDKSSIVSELNSHMGSGIYITYDGIQIVSDGALTINTSQFDLDEYGNASFGGELSAPTGSIGGFKIDGNTMQTDPSLLVPTYPYFFGIYMKSGGIDSNTNPMLAIGYTDANDISHAKFRVNTGGALHVEYAYVHRLTMYEYLADASSSHTLRYPVWKRVSDAVTDNDYVLTGATSV